MSDILSDITIEELINRIIQRLSEAKDSDIIQLVSDLDANMVQKMSRLRVIADFFSSDLLTNFHDNYLRLRVSNRRQGRQEFVKLGIAVGEEQSVKRWWKLWKK